MGNGAGNNNQIRINSITRDVTQASSKLRSTASVTGERSWLCQLGLTWPWFVNSQTADLGC
jgi:hypothetical protein